MPNTDILEETESTVYEDCQSDLDSSSESTKPPSPVITIKKRGRKKKTEEEIKARQRRYYQEVVKPKLGNSSIRGRPRIFPTDEARIEYYKKKRWKDDTPPKRGRPKK